MFLRSICICFKDSWQRFIERKRPLNEPVGSVNSESSSYASSVRAPKIKHCYRYKAVIEKVRWTYIMKFKEITWIKRINGANLALLTVATQKYRRNAANINRGLVAFASEWSSSPKRLIPGASSERRRSGSRKWEPEKTPSIAGSEVISGRIQGFRLTNVGPGLN